MSNVLETFRQGLSNISASPTWSWLSRGTTRRWLDYLASLRPRAATVGSNPDLWRGSARPPTLSTRALWRLLAPPSSTLDSPQTPSRRDSLDTRPPTPTASMPTRLPSQATSGSWRMSRPPTVNTGPSSALRHRTAGGWGSATSVWWRRLTSPWLTPGPH